MFKNEFPRWSALGWIAAARLSSAHIEKIRALFRKNRRGRENGRLRSRTHDDNRQVEGKFNLLYLVCEYREGADKSKIRTFGLSANAMIVGRVRIRQVTKV